MYPIVAKLTQAFDEAIRIHDIQAAEMYHRQLEEYKYMNPMEESEDEMDAGAYSITGLDPIQMEYAKNLAEERARKQQEMLDMQNMIISGGIGLAGLTAVPGSITGASTGLVSGTSAGRISGGSNVTFQTYAKPMAVLHEVTQAEKDADKRRHLKLFVHFAKEFVARYPKWTLVPDEKDPLHSVHLLMKERGAMIHNLYPSNEMAVYGGPASWVDPRKELGQALPIVKINTQEFWGWCVGMDDVPEWMV